MSLTWSGFRPAELLRGEGPFVLSLVFSDQLWKFHTDHGSVGEAKMAASQQTGGVLRDGRKMPDDRHFLDDILLKRFQHAIEIIGTGDPVLHFELLRLVEPQCFGDDRGSLTGAFERRFMIGQCPLLLFSISV